MQQKHDHTRTHPGSGALEEGISALEALKSAGARPDASCYNSLMASCAAVALGSDGLELACDVLGAMRNSSSSNSALMTEDIRELIASAAIVGGVQGAVCKGVQLLQGTRTQAQSIVAHTHASRSVQMNLFACENAGMHRGPKAQLGDNSLFETEIMQALCVYAHNASLPLGKAFNAPTKRLHTMHDACILFFFTCLMCGMQ